LDELRRIAPEFGEDFYAAVSLRAVLDCHDVVGGTATARVREAVIAMRRRANALKEGSHVCA
ncbi:MAG TPA: argininosuccinate lyase, partial [Clostridia bacterium]|nr:argininosuccinate lyase [Clostridia bacterium]